MFSGIVHDRFPVTHVNTTTGSVGFGVRLNDHLMADLQYGASIAIDGVCLTVSTIQDNTVNFCMMGETLNRTTLGSIAVGRLVNVERSLRHNDEIGGHIVSGHVFGIAEIIAVDHPENNHVVTFRIPVTWSKYLFSKGFVALDGVSLTVVDLNRERGVFTVWLIPETLKRTTFGFKDVGDQINVEFESNTQVIVDTIERLAQEGRLIPSTSIAT